MSGGFHSLCVRYREGCFALDGGTGCGVGFMIGGKVWSGLVKCPGACSEDVYFKDSCIRPYGM